MLTINGQYRARPKFFCGWMCSKFQEMFLRVLSFASGKNFDHTQSVGHGQNVVQIFPPQVLDGMTSNVQKHTS